jgi:ubiquinol-cytochrome c reductase cytochrome c subunit
MDPKSSLLPPQRSSVATRLGRGARRVMRPATILPALVVASAGLGGLLVTAASASPAAPTTTTTTGPSPITYVTDDNPADIAAGRVLYENNCSSCHNSDGSGGVGPNLRGVGPAVVDFWVGTGRMPLAVAATQATRKPPRFTGQSLREIVAFVSSLAPTGIGYPPGVPRVDVGRADLATGSSLFVLNCAACHTITGAGDALANGAYAPSLHRATATAIAEAVRTGPGNMPPFGPGQLSDQQVTDVVGYVRQEIQHPDNAGGAGLGGIGPVAEGFIALLVGVGGLMLVTLWIGERA